MRVLSVCSGIGTDAVAWHSLGWEHLCFSEIEKFPAAVLKHRWPDVPNEGDFTKIGDKYRGATDVLVGGTPCQSFSVAGLRGGLADDRGNLALEFLRLADRTRPRWVVWENVPGVLSSNGGRDFGSILGGLGQLGYGWAYRVLDAQHFGVPQRRRRVFVVGCIRDWRAAAAVLFERHSLQGDHPPRREKGQGFTHDVAPCIGASGRGFERTGDTRGQDAVIAFGGSNTSGPIEVLTTCNASGGIGRLDFESETFITHSLRADGFDASEDGTGRGTPIVVAAHETGQGFWQSSDVAGTLRAEGENRPSRPSNVVAFSAKDHGADAAEDISPTLRAGGFDKSHANSGNWMAVAFHENQRAEVTVSDTAGSLKVGGGKPGQGYPAIAVRTAQTSANGHGVAEDVAHTLDQAQGQAVCFEPGSIARHAGPAGKKTLSPTLRSYMGNNQPAVRQGMAVRRLTPRECERLQGLPDDYTLIPYNGKMAADGPRYKAIGNGMAVPVIKWIAERIKAVSL